MNLDAGLGVLNRERVMEHRQSSISEIHHSHSCVREVALAEALLSRTSNHILNVIIQKEMEGVRIMDCDIQDDTSPRFRTVESPALQARRQINRMKDSSRQRLANDALFDQPAHGSMTDSVPQMMISTKNEALIFSGPHHGLGVSQ